MADVKLHLPIAVLTTPTSIHPKEHATNVGVMFRGKDNSVAAELAAGLPVGYNGRASTVVVSGGCAGRAGS